MTETAETAVRPSSDIADRDLAPEGRERLQWVSEQMPVLAQIGTRFAAEKPLAGTHVGLCLPVIAEAAHLVATLQHGGASVSVCGTPSHGIDDGVAAYMASDLGATVFANSRVDSTESAYRSVIENGADLLVEDGGHVLSFALDQGLDISALRGSVEHSWSGIRRIVGSLGDEVTQPPIPVVCTGWSQTRSLVDDHYGVGQATVAGILRTAKVLLAGKTMVVIGYGRRGRGVARRASGHGAEVVIVESDPMRALEAHMDGFRLLPLSEAAPFGEIFVTSSGSRRVIRKKHFNAMRNGSFVCNCGYDKSEIDLEGLAELSRTVRQIRPKLEECCLLDGRKIYLLGEGLPMHVATSEGRPPEVADLTYSHLALSLVWRLEDKQSDLPAAFHKPPPEIDQRIAGAKLASLALETEETTSEQERFGDQWPAVESHD